MAMDAPTAGVMWGMSGKVMVHYLFPSGIMASVGIFLNFFVWGVHSSGAIPFVSLLQLLAMWICVSLPLLFLGFFFGFRKRPYAQPVRTNQIPRQVPEQDWYKNTLATTALSGTFIILVPN